MNVSGRTKNGKGAPRELFKNKLMMNYDRDLTTISIRLEHFFLSDS